MTAQAQLTAHEPPGRGPAPTLSCNRHKESKCAWTPLCRCCKTPFCTRTSIVRDAQACQADCCDRTASCLDSEESSTAAHKRKRLFGRCRRNWKWEDHPDSSIACESRLGRAGLHRLHSATQSSSDHSGRTCCPRISLPPWSRGKPTSWIIFHVNWAPRQLIIIINKAKLVRRWATLFALMTNPVPAPESGT